MPVAVTAIAGTVTVINGTFTLVQTFFKLAEVDEDLKICLSLLAIAGRDLNNARRQLWNRKSDQSLQLSNADLEHFESAIKDAEAARLSLGQLVEAYRVQRDVDKRISPGHRFKWVVQGKDRFVSRQGVLIMAHNSLLAAVHRMDTVAPLFSQSAVPPPYNQAAPASHSKILRSPSQERILRGKSSMILRSSSAWPPQEPAPLSPILQDRQSS